MANKQPGFMVYLEDWRSLEMLTDRQFRAVFNAVMEFVETGAAEPPKDLAAGVVFRLLQPKLKFDAERYAQRVEKARMAGRMGAQARWGEGERTDAGGGVG